MPVKFEDYEDGGFDFFVEPDPLLTKETAEKVVALWESTKSNISVAAKLVNDQFNVSDPEAIRSLIQDSVKLIRDRDLIIMN